MSTDVPLADKEAFYSQLAWIDAASGSDDEMPQEDRELRGKNKKFFQQALSKDNITTSSRKPTTDPILTTDKSQTRVSRRSNTAPTPLSTLSAATVIKATPGGSDSSRRPKRQKLPVSTSFIEDTPRQEPCASAVAKLRRSATNPVSLHSSSKALSSQPAPSSAMGARKRKREAGIPQSDQILRGLRFFYIPEDRKNPVRRGRMEHAEKYGAAVTSELTDATHVIVDDNLTFGDIRDRVASVIDQDQPLIVREHWPLHSIEQKRLLPTTSSWYRVLPPPKATNPSIPAASAADKPTRGSLEVKAPRNDPNRQDHDPHRTPSQSEKSSAPQFESPSAAHVTIPSSQPSSGDGASRAGPTSNHPAGHDYGDELSRLIQDAQKNFKDLPSIEGDDDEKKKDDKDSDDTSESESEGKKAAKRPKKSKLSKPRLEDNFACSRGGTKDKTGGPNARTIEILQQMCDYYTRTNDHWRTLAYRKVINTLSMHPKKVITAEEARLLPHIGQSTSSKIEEIVNTDRLRRLEHAQNDPKSKVLQLFLGIYGVGLSVAHQWIAQGFRTLNDLLRHAPLTPNQRVGIEHYQDLNMRVPRAEVKALGDYVKDEAARIDKRVELLIGGSYRRGADDSGDIDFIITKAGTKSSEELTPFLDKLVVNLTKKGFLTAELASHNSRGSSHQKHGEGSTWHGCCVLPRVARKDGHRPWRRIDLLLVYVLPSPVRSAHLDY